MAYVIRPTALVPITVLSAYVLLFHRAWFVRYICWGLVITLPWITYNLSVYGRLLPIYYSGEAFSAQTRFVEGLLGNLFSPSRGLFVFSPVLLFAPSGFVLALRDRAERPLIIAYGAIVVANASVIGAANMWWAGHAFGPRFTTDIVPFLVYFTAFNFRLPETIRPRTRRAVFAAVGVLALASMTIHAQGAFRYATWEWNYVPDDIDQNNSRAWDWLDPQFARTTGR
jgi:hypothetical protein